MSTEYVAHILVGRHCFRFKLCFLHVFITNADQLVTLYITDVFKYPLTLRFV